MGKIPPSFRSAISNPFLRRPSSLVPAETSQLTVTPSGKPHYQPKKTSNKKPSQLPGKVKEAKDSDPSTTQKALKLFKSPSLSDAKDVFDSFIKSSKTFIDQRSYNSLFQAYASISTVNDSAAFLRHMMKSSPSESMLLGWSFRITGHIVA